MQRIRKHLLPKEIQLIISLLLCQFSVGCHTPLWREGDLDLNHYVELATQVEAPDFAAPAEHSLTQLPVPLTISDSVDKLPKRELALSEAIQLALANEEIVKNLGGRIISSPQASSATEDVALVELNPTSGTEAALAAFDAQFSLSTLWNRQEQTLNNIFFGGGTNSLASETAAFQAQISKTAATGTQLTARNRTNYDLNNAPTNTFPSSWQTFIDAEIRHPLLQGGGIEFNRIAGPNAQPGVYNGVLLARVNTDISIVQLETAVRNLVLNIETAYWDLHFAYRDLEAKQEARDAALTTWKEQKDSIGENSTALVAQAREQYFSTQAQVEAALMGQVTGTVETGVVGSRTTGVIAAQRRLRSLIGLVAQDGQIILPVTEPTLAKVTYDWQDSLWQGLTGRPELHRQQWVIRKREMELSAARNFQQMRLDLIAQYRWRGFGDDLLGNSGVQNGSAFGDLFGGDLQEWTLGFELSNPIGNRKGHLAVRHAELQLSRERAIYREQEKQIATEISAAFTEVSRAHQAIRTAYNRLYAADENSRSLRELKNAGETVQTEFILSAQSRLSAARSAYHRAVLDYNLALANFEATRGSLLSYQGISLAEGGWSTEAHHLAQRQMRRYKVKELDYCCQYPLPLTSGGQTQQVTADSSESNVPAQPESIPLPEEELTFPPEAEELPQIIPDPTAVIPAEREQNSEDISALESESLEGRTNQNKAAAPAETPQSAQLPQSPLSSSRRMLRKQPQEVQFPSDSATNSASRPEPPQPQTLQLNRPY